MAPERRHRFPEPSLHERHNMLTDSMQLQFIRPIGSATGKFFEDLYHEVDPEQGQPHLWPIIDEVWDMASHRGMNPIQQVDYVIEQLPRAFAAILLREDPDFLLNVKWPEAFARLKDPSVRHEFIMFTILPIQSNVSDRAKAFEYELKVHGFLKDVIALELGSGGNYIPKHMALRWPYSPTEVMERRKSGGRNRYVKNAEASMRFDEELARPIIFKRIIGTDIFNPNDWFIKEWRMACSLYFDERLIKAKVEKNNELENVSPENVEWRWGDITDYQPNDYQEDFPGEPFPHLTFASFVIYLLKEREQQAALQNLAAFAIKGAGLAAVLDDIHAIDADHQPTIVRRKRNFSSTGLWIFNGQRPELGWLKHMSIRTGRVDAVVFEPPLEDVLRNNSSNTGAPCLRAPRTSA